MSLNKADIITGICIFIAIEISKLLKLEFPFFVTLAIIMPIQGTYFSSVRAGKNRMVGTIVGATIGVILVSIKPGNPILCGIGIVIIIYLCKLIKWQYAAPIGGIVFIAIMVNLKGKNPIYYSIDRVIDTFIGVCITIIIHFITSLKNNQEKINRDLISLQNEMLYIIKEKICLGNNINLNNFNKHILDLENQVNGKMKGFIKNENKQKQMSSMKKIVDLYKKVNENLKIIYTLGTSYNLNNNNFENLSMICDDIVNNGLAYGNETRTVYNYFVSKIIDDINSINKILIEFRLL